MEGTSKMLTTSITTTTLRMYDPKISPCPWRKDVKDFFLIAKKSP